MRRLCPIFALLLGCTGLAHGNGLLIPTEKSLPPLAMLSHKVSIRLEEQVAVTQVDQVFRNHTERPLEATYVFPVPRGASVNKFTMWIDGKETRGELVEAKKARDIYTSIVRRTQDPGLLEYIGNDLLQVKVFPVPAKGDQRVALSYTSVAGREGGLVEYIYPLKTDGKATATLETFSVEATIKSQHAVLNVYSPTHALSLRRINDNEVRAQFEKAQGLLDKDFQLFYQLGDRDVGLTALTHRPMTSENGYFLALITPKVQLSPGSQLPRDVVLVLDTSGSMRGPKMEQARKAMRYCLENLNAQDRFALINFATTVNRFRDTLSPASGEHLVQGRKWVDALEPTGGTAIQDALLSALDFRSKDESRTFTVVFFTDGQPTIGETKPEKILSAVQERHTANTRLFTFGVGDDVNAAMLDSLAERTRALSTYVRPAEDIEAKVSGLYSRISHPVLTNLRLATTGDVSLTEVYPPNLPDLFHGQQLVVLGRYTGKGPSALRLNGSVGKETREFVYELTFPEKTEDGRGFVEEIWARRKVGYMLDQIRTNGEKKELVDEVTSLARRYGITTPYTSWLIVPDAPVPVASAPEGRAAGETTLSAPRPGGLPGISGGGGFGGGMGGAVRGSSAPAGPVSELLRRADAKKAEDGKADLSKLRGNLERERLEKSAAKESKAGSIDEAGRALRETRDRFSTFEMASDALRRKAQVEVHAGKLGVDFAQEMSNLRAQSRLANAPVRMAQGRRCLEVSGVWIDEGYAEKLPTLVIKAQSEAYFRILELQPSMKEVFRLGNHLVWVAPSGTALIIDTREGKEKVNDNEIRTLFIKK